MPELEALQMPEPEALERMIEQAGRGDWVQDAFLRVLAADSLEKGEPLPPLLRNYIATLLKGSHCKAVVAEFREVCLLMVDSLTSYLRPDIAREEVEDLAVKAVERIRQTPEMFGRCSRLPESLRGLESVVIWVLFMVKQWEIVSTNIEDARKLRSWQEAVEAVSERLDSDREAVCGKQRKPRSGYAPRSIANILKYFMGLRGAIKRRAEPPDLRPRRRSGGPPRGARRRRQRPREGSPPDGGNSVQ
jgi:hypothetical protein